MEVEAIVADYVQMLALELGGQAFNKTAHRRELVKLLVGRTESSIEFKHCNISAVLIELGFPYIRGYQPRVNFQQLLAEVVATQVSEFSLLDKAALAAVEQPAALATHIDIDFAKVKVEAPVRQVSAQASLPPSFAAMKRNYLEREGHNRSLGLAGEEFVVDFERWRLVECGQASLAGRVEHVSKTKGDGLGFDVLSFNLDGSERLVEVKTTTFGRDTPFFVSKNEVSRSMQSKDTFHLYRLFEFRRRPRLFDLSGSLEQNCFLDPVTYRATFV